MTFNNYFTHHCLPTLFKKKDYFDAFYRNILVNPTQLQGFFTNFLQVAAQNVDENVEKPFKADSFEISLYRTIEKGIIHIGISEWEQTRDCVAIAFPTDPQKAGYYTCEYSVSPFDNSEHFYLGEWAIGTGQMEHNNWGEISPTNSTVFMEMLFDLVYNQ